MRRLLLAALAAVAALPADAAPVRYGLTLAGLPLGVLTIDGDRSGDRYEAAVRFESGRTRGPPRLWPRRNGRGPRRAGQGSAAAPLRRREPFPARGAADADRVDRRHSRFRRRRSAARRGGGARQRRRRPRPGVRAPAPRRPRPAAEACSESVAVFDGSRLVRLTLGAPAQVADGIACDGTYLRLGGEPLTPIDPPECPFRLVYRIAADGRAVLQQIRVPTRFGEALIERRVSLTEMNSQLTSTH